MSDTNFMSYDNAQSVLGGFANAIKGKDDPYTTITYSDWLNLTDQEKESGKYYITGAPGADGSIQVDLMTKLWENPSPTAEFANNAKVIDLPSEYDFLMIVCTYSTSDNRQSSVIFENGYGTSVFGTGSDVLGAYRLFTVTNNKLFAGNARKNLASPTVDNNYIIPIKLYGIKTTQTIRLNAIASDVSTSADKCMLSDGETSVEDRIEDLIAITNHTYEGKDLTVVFASEIANYSDEWAWIQARLDSHDVSGISVGDYIPINIAANGGIAAETHKAEIAGINTYRRTGDSGHEVGYHIDWITRDCYSGTVKFNTTNINNGNASNSNPFLASNLKSWLDGTLYGLLDAKLKAVIKSKRILAPYRYQSGATLTDDNSVGWQDFDKLWVPLECEIFDSLVWSTKGNGNCQAVQYPIFANSYEHRVKGAGPGGAMVRWWTASTYSGNSTSALRVSDNGSSGGNDASSMFYVPVCFRTMES